MHAADELKDVPEQDSGGPGRIRIGSCRELVAWRQKKMGVKNTAGNRREVEGRIRTPKT